ncbi:MAG: DUF3987 domain-containing protein [Candidatus Kapabacteria bacterium]|nr:DUF3987 domain-containing protein [Candidatus Kapabacteria bacterium]
MFNTISTEQITNLLGILKSKNGNYHCINAKAHHNGDKNASLSISMKNGKTVFNCFSCGIKGGLYQLVSLSKNISLEEAKKLVNKDLFGNEVKTPKQNKKIVSGDFSFTCESGDIYNYLEKYNITNEVMGKNKVFSVKSFTNIENGTTVNGNKQNPIYLTIIENGFVKIYQPLSKKYKHKFYGKGKNEILFGKNIFNKEIKELIITGGLKDMLVLQTLGFSAISFNSETTMNLDDKFLKFVESKNINVFLLYDNDQTGIQSSEALSNKYGFYKLESINSMLVDGKKDISDLIYYLNDKSLVKSIIDKIKLEMKFITKSKAESSFISENLIKILPKYFKDFISNYESDKEKELLIISLLVALSSVFHKFNIVYDKKILYLNLYAFIIAEAGSGKSIMLKVKQLIDGYIKQFNVQSKGDYRSFIVPGNISKSALYLSLADNKGCGLIIESEADVISSSQKTEYGETNDLLRNFFHNERVSVLRKDTSSNVTIENPKLALLISGTPNQVRKLIDTSENGLFSRFFYKIMNSTYEFKDDIFDDIDLIENKINELSEQLLKFMNKIESDKDIRIIMPKELGSRFINHFKLKASEIERAEVKKNIGLVYRLGAKYIKSMGVLAVARLIFEESIPDKIIISEEDFQIMRIIGDSLESDSDLIFNLYQTNTKNQDVFQYLPREFNANHLKKLSIVIAKDERTVRRLLDEEIQNGKIIRVKQGEYKKLV